MTRKQMGLIFTLMALLVCVAVLSLKLNENGLKDPTDLTSLIMEQKTDQEKNDEKSDEKKSETKTDAKDEQETSASTDSMYALRTDREKTDASTIQSLEAIINNSNSSKEQKDMATQELSLKNKIVDQQKRIELNIKTLGYADAICFLDSGKAKVYVKTTETLDTTKLTAIREVVEDVATTVTEVSAQAQK